MAELELGESVRSLDEYPGYYVSDFGNVYSTWASSGRGSHPNGPMRRLKPVAASGRVQVNLHRGGGQKSVRVHRLVLLAFIGPQPAGMEACHFPDSDTSNNRLDNLRWDTPAANQADKVVHGTSNHGERNGSARLDSAQVAQIRRRYAEGETQSSLATAFSVTRSNVAHIVNERTW